MRIQHVQVLDIQRTRSAGQEVVDLAIIVEKGHTLFRNFFAREVVRFQFHVGWEPRRYC